MSGLFVDSTPTAQVSIENPFLGFRYPVDGSVLSILDTGYEGFVCVPEDIFEELRFRELKFERRRIMLANGQILESTGAYGTLSLVGVGLRLDGFVESYEGLGEILVGTEAFRGLRVILDYCARKLTLAKC